MSDLSTIQLILIGLIFIWSGFVRAGLGFGGVALALPLMLLIVDHPVLWLPICSSHLLIFSLWSVYDRLENIDWKFIRRAMLIVIVPKIAGVLGLLKLPPELVSNAIYIIIIGYALTYILNYQFSSKGRLVDNIMLVIGGYASGVSLIGAPLISAVMVRHVTLSRIRDTMFAFWVVLVSIKLSTFVVFGVDLQIRYMLYLLPFAGIGHWLGVKLHQRLIEGDGVRFKRVLGLALLVICSYGLWSNA
ncbi:MAG: TSUP family transporter [bacterium]